MPRNEKNRMPSPIRPISDTAPRTMPASKRLGARTKTERSKLISTPRKPRAPLPDSTPEIDAAQSSPTEQPDLASPPYSVIGSTLSEAAERPCFPSAKDLMRESELNHPLASPEDIHEDQRDRHPLRSPPRGCETDPNFAGISSGQNALQGEVSLHSGAQGTLFHSPSEGNSHANYDRKGDSPSPFYPGAQAPVNFGNQPSGVSLEVSASQLSRLGLYTANGGPGVRTQEPSGPTGLRVRTGLSTHRDPSAPISSESGLIMGHSGGAPSLAIPVCTQAAPEITHPTNSITHLLQPLHGVPRGPPDDLVSSPVFTSSGSNPSPRGAFLQMEDIPRETYQFETEWPSPSPSATLSFDALEKDSLSVPFCHGAPFSGTVSKGIRAEVHSFCQAAPDSQHTSHRNLFPIVSTCSGYPSIGSRALTGQAWVPVGIKDPEDYGGAVDEGEDQDMILLNPHVGFFSNCFTGYGTVHSISTIRKCERLNISDPGGEEDGEEAHENLPRNWGEASVFSNPLQALNEPVDEEILKRNDTAHEHSEDLYKLLNAPSYQAIDGMPDIDQSWRRIKLPVVTFRGPWQDIPNPDEDALGGKYYGQILYSWTPPKRQPIKSGPPTQAALGLPVSNSTPTVQEGQQQAAKPLSIVERRMAKQRAGIRKSSRAKNPSLKK